MNRKSLFWPTCMILLISSIHAFSFGGQLVSKANRKITETGPNNSTEMKSQASVMAEFENKDHASIVYKNDLLEQKLIEDTKKTGSMERDLVNILSQHDLAVKKLKKDFYVIETADHNKQMKSGESAGKENSSQRLATQKELAIKVSGTVTSKERGETIPGVNILLKGTNMGTVSDVDGRYNIDAPENGVLIFSRISH